MPPRNNGEILILPSVLDRLLGEQAEVLEEPFVARSRGLQVLKQSLKRDLEWLLNTRQMADGLPEDLNEVNKSVIAFGLPDFSTMSAQSAPDRNRLRRALETAILTFEPRLKDPVVTIEPLREGQQTLRFRIDAQLRLQSTAEHIVFNTVLDLRTGKYLVQAA